MKFRNEIIYVIASRMYFLYQILTFEVAHGKEIKDGYWKEDKSGRVSCPTLGSHSGFHDRRHPKPRNRGRNESSTCFSLKIL